MHIADTLSRHFPKLSETSQKLGEHILFARSGFEEDLEAEQDIQEVNHLLVSEHKSSDVVRGD